MCVRNGILVSEKQIFHDFYSVLTEMLVHKFFKSIVNKKQSISKNILSNIFMRLRLTAKIFSNLEKILSNNDLQQLKRGLISSYKQPRLVSYNRIFENFPNYVKMWNVKNVHFYNKKSASFFVQFCMIVQKAFNCAF